MTRPEKSPMEKLGVEPSSAALEADALPLDQRDGLPANKARKETVASSSSWWSLGLEDDIVPLSVGMGVALQADPGPAEPCTEDGRHRLHRKPVRVGV